jgi:hypothetical protein
LKLIEARILYRDRRADGYQNPTDYVESLLRSLGNNHVYGSGAYRSRHRDMARD